MSQFLDEQGTQHLIEKIADGTLVAGKSKKATEDEDGSNIKSTYATKSELSQKQNQLTFDDTPTQNSNNPVKSGGIHSALAQKISDVQVDGSSIVEDGVASIDSDNFGKVDDVKLGGSSIVNNKEANIPVDTVPTEGSSNLITSGGIYEKLTDVAHLVNNNSEATTVEFDPQSDTIWNKPQVLSESQKGNARVNIGAASASEVSASISALQSLYQGLTQTDIVIVQAENWPLDNLQQNTVYRVTGVSSYTDYMYDGSNAIAMASYTNTPLYDSLGQNTDGSMTQRSVTESINKLDMEVFDDISSYFTFTDGYAIRVSDATNPSSTVFASSDAVDISRYSGSMLRITMPKYTASGGSGSGYGLVFFDSSGVKISGVVIKLYNSDNVRVEIIEVPIPENAVTIRTTYWKSDSSYKTMEFSAIAHSNTIAEKFIQVENEVSGLNESIESLDDSVNNLTDEVELVNAKIEGGFHELGIDLTGSFNFNTKGYPGPNGGNASPTSSVFKMNSTAVNIADYVGKYLRIALPRYNTSGGGRTPAYICILNGSGTVIWNKQLDKFDPSTSVTSQGDVAIYEFYIPEGAVSVKSTFYTAGSSFITQSFICHIVESVTGVKDGIDDIKSFTYGNEGETEFKNILFTDAYAVNAVGNASLVSASAQSVTDMIDVSGYDSIRVTVNQRSDLRPTVGCAFYNSDSQALDIYPGIYNADGPAQTIVIQTYKVPKDAKYFRTTIFTTFKGSFKLFGYKSITANASVIDLNQKLFYPLIGSPRIYHSSSIPTGTTAFTSVDQVYTAWDNLVTNHPDWISKKTDIGMDQSNTYAIRHYEFGWQHKDINTSRSRSGTNYWRDDRFKMRRILLNLGTHTNEDGALLAGYLSIKELLESSEEWAQFIKANFVIDIIPILNPWGLDNKSSSTGRGVDVNCNSVNINRDFDSDEPQSETLACKSLIQSLIPLGLVGSIDLHNTGTSEESYLVSSSRYKLYPYYARLAMQIQGFMYDTLNEYFLAMYNHPYGEHFHMWDVALSSEQKKTGQLHWYMDSIGLPGVTIEVSPTNSVSAAKISKDYCINLIQTFGTMFYNLNN